MQIASNSSPLPLHRELHAAARWWFCLCQGAARRPAAQHVALGLSGLKLTRREGKARGVVCVRTPVRGRRCTRLGLLDPVFRERDVRDDSARDRTVTPTADRVPARGRGSGVARLGDTCDEPADLACPAPIGSRVAWNWR